MKLNAFVQSAATEKAHLLKQLMIIVMALVSLFLQAQAATDRRFCDILHLENNASIQQV